MSGMDKEKDIAKIKYLIIYHRYEGDDWHLSDAESPEEALLYLYEEYGGSSILNFEELKKFAQNFGLEKLIKLFEKEHYAIAYIGEFNPLYEEER